MPCLIILFTTTLIHSPQADAQQKIDQHQIRFQAERHRERIRMCGPLSIVRALTILNHSIDGKQWLRQFASERSTGVSIRDVVSACREFEPRTRLVHVPKDNTAYLDFPCILIVNDAHHCLVAESRVGNQLRVWDPSVLKHLLLSDDRVRAIWDGDAIVFGRCSLPEIALDGTLTVAAILLLTATVHQAKYTLISFTSYFGYNLN